MRVIGLDIGGANLKAADTEGRALVRPFAVWKAPERLKDELASLLGELPEADCLAVTMTAELADCYRSKAEGVDRVLQAAEAAAGTTPVVVWQTGAEFVPPEVAREIPRLVAAANWHALATWVGRLAPKGAALLLDVGSTTTDIIPLLEGVPVPAGLTDVERLQSGELVYSGVKRTPVCAVVHSVPLGHAYCPLAAELFATMQDVYLLLQKLPEDATDCDTADGRPATLAAAHQRLARMLCCDGEELRLEGARQAARFIADVQRQRITAAVDRVLKAREAECAKVIVSGSGAFLANEILREHHSLAGVPTVRLSECFNAETSQAACALAVARLASERVPGE